MLRYALALVFALVAQPAPATGISEWGDYTVSRQDGKTTVQHAVFGTWEGFIAENRPVSVSPVRHTLQFEFETPDYFSDDNRGHFAVAVLADNGPAHLTGHGVVIGNVSGYGIYPGGCVQAPHANAVTIESFWPGGNCVWGDVSTSVRLVNDQRYRLTLTSEMSSAGEPGRIVRYVLERKRPSYWATVDTAVLFDPSPVPEGFSGIFILEVFSEHDWTVNFYNVTEILE